MTVYDQHTLQKLGKFIEACFNKCINNLNTLNCRRSIYLICFVFVLFMIVYVCTYICMHLIIDNELRIGICTSMCILIYLDFSFHLISFVLCFFLFHYIHSCSLRFRMSWSLLYIIYDFIILLFIV